jgi:DNA repair protein RecN (Recombination protein N)
MLTELTIRDFAIIDELHLTFPSGFTALTGETGAGKSIILDAMTLALGGRADTSMVRTGCERAYVEAAFELTPAVNALIAPVLAAEELDGEDSDFLVLSRELRLNGRNSCRMNGRVVNLTLLREVGEYLVGIHGQGEHLALLKPQAHLPLLDAYAGLEEERQALAGVVRQVRADQRELAERRRSEQLLAQRLDLLRFQIEEIDAARLIVGEEEELQAEAQRLANVEQLLQFSTETLSLLVEGDEGLMPAAELLNQAERALSQLVRLDPVQQPLLERLQGLTFQLTEWTEELRHYQEQLEFNPGRLNYVEERLQLISRLKRKYGGDLAAVLQYRETAVAELSQIEQSEERIEALALLIERQLRAVGQMAEALSVRRQTAAAELARAVEIELADLQMQEAQFAVHFEREPDPVSGAYLADGRYAFDQSGIDRVEFLVSANPGELLRPLARVASGGETARLMLALKTVLARVDATPTLIFDEIDQGIGGRVGDVVGRKLWGLAANGGHQVIVVTHLPQLAGYGDGHFYVSKQQAEGRTTTAVLNLDKPGRVVELAAMLGTQGEHAQGGAAAILRQAEEYKTAFQPAAPQ